MDCHRPLDFCCAARAPGAPATPGGCGPAAALARGVALLRQGPGPTGLTQPGFHAMGAGNHWKWRQMILELGGYE